ncbi:uncharacterized protein LODBEIA_P12980 [Lodderomyces beijingensis]|uniref:WD40 repeat-like protein n=1 Tax=Lodderomyces beijingensis TaxID=1775926 RepID=A0ABP0ZFW4_9ASCO
MSSKSIKSPKRSGFLTKLIGKKGSRSRSSSLVQSSDTSNGSLSPAKGNGLHKIPSSDSGAAVGRRGRDPSVGLAGDNDSFLYDDDEDASEGYESDFSSSNSLGRIASTSTRKGRARAGTFDNHRADEKVVFPRADENMLNSDLDTLHLGDDQDPPWVGLTYESFLTPKYIKLSKRNKQSPKVINNLFLAQELNVDNGDGKRSVRSSVEELERGSYEADNAGFEDTSTIGMTKEIFVMKFSRDGKYLAAAGRDAVIRIWKVISSPLGRLEYNQQEKEAGTPERSSKSDTVFDSAPVFHRTPIELRGHSRSILSLAWSKNNFLISGSMDKTAKLWHVDRPDCLQTFQHEDFVTAVEFHPLDDRFFLSGSLDNEVRLWSVLEKSVSYWRNLGEDVLITALSFTPDGLYCVVGGFNGSLFVLETKGLHIVNRVEIKQRSLVPRFHDRSGNKITGIEVFENPAHGISDQPGPNLDKWTVLITTNDSKVRMVSTDRKKLITRFKGYVNNSSSIAAAINYDHKYVIAGSEDHYCYVWENNNSIINNKLRQSVKEFVVDGKQHMNDFSSKHEKYSKLFQANKFLSKLFDTEDDSKHDFIANENNSYTAFHAHHSKCNVGIFAPQSTMNLLALSDDLIYDLKKRGEACKMDPTKCCCSSSRDNHHHHNNNSCSNHTHENEVTNGDIIVTTDQYGLVRVFRQDCASPYRKQFIEFYKKCRNQAGDTLSPSDTVRTNTRTLRRGASVQDRQSPTRGDSGRRIKDVLSSQIGGHGQANGVALGSRPIERSLSPQSSKFSSIPASSTLASSQNYTYGSGKSNIFDQPVIQINDEDEADHLQHHQHQHQHHQSLNHQNLYFQNQNQGQGQGKIYRNRNSSETTLNAVPNEHAKTIDSRQETFPIMDNPNSIPKQNVPQIVLPSEEQPGAVDSPPAQNNGASSLPHAIQTTHSNGSHSRLGQVPIHPSH